MNTGRPGIFPLHPRAHDFERKYADWVYFIVPVFGLQWFQVSVVRPCAFLGPHVVSFLVFDPASRTGVIPTLRANLFNLCIISYRVIYISTI